MHYTSLYSPPPPTPVVNLHDFVFDSPAYNEPDKVIFIEPLAGRQWYRDEVRQRINEGATALVTPEADGGFGLSPDGELVAVMSTNCVEYILLAHALFKTTNPLVLIPSGATAFELEHFLSVSTATRLFVHASLLPIALTVTKKLGFPDSRIYVLSGDPQSGRRDLMSAMDEIRRRNIPHVPSKPVKDDTLLYLVFSSGTSGLPKAVMLSHKNTIASMVEVAHAAAGDDPHPFFEKNPPIGLGFLPIYHTYGLHFICIRPVWTATAVILIPRWNADLVLDLIPKYRINVVPFTPPAILQLVNHRRIREVDLSSLVSMGSGASHLPPKVANAFTRLAKNVGRVNEGFGMSECTVSATRACPESKFGGPRPGSTGVLLPGVEARIVRDDGTLAGADEPGELWLRGDIIALGYWRNPKATAETFVDGWLRTGDRFRVDRDQHFFFVERIKDVLKVSGQQVSPTELENVLLACPDRLVADVAVAGVHAPGTRLADERVPRAWVVLSDAGSRRGADAAVRALDAWIRTSLSKFKWLRGGIAVVDEIPKNPTGKVLRRVLVQQYEEQLKTAPQAKL
ncbi:acetyl-CoA synthetase-like protein [Epithele typhae]|uniref:acetyl-CoA synthetase-like protein n=1 Tax=Epithele typhae TaxID=378194 RepID=UPI002008269B|nr:acetyl-CoA synthetase-like protein [Epithele typhae]KAH9933123.1 acetyl-CoA synthetase-like protein [Epithele typhae]